MAKLMLRNQTKGKGRKEKKVNSLTFLSSPYFIVLALLIVLPFFIMILYAFSSTSAGIFDIRFTLGNFQVFFEQKLYVLTMLESLYIAAMSTIVTLLIGYPVAYIMTKLKARHQVLMLALITSPMWINMLIRANALKQIVDMFFPKLLGTDFIIIVGNAYMFLPFMVLPIYTVLSKIDKSLLESSADLGAKPYQTFMKVVVPLSLSGVISGAMMVFLPAATTLVVPKYLGDGKRTFIGNLVEFAVMERHDYGYGAAVSIILGIILIIFVVLIKKFDKYGEVDSNE